MKLDGRGLGRCTVICQMPSNESSLDPLLLDRYFAGEATAEEHQTVESWLASNPDEQGALAALGAGIAAAYGPLPPYNRDVRIAAVVDYSVRVARRNRRQPLRESGAGVGVICG